MALCLLHFSSSTLVLSVPILSTRIEISFRFAPANPTYNHMTCSQVGTISGMQADRQTDRLPVCCNMTQHMHSCPPYVGKVSSEWIMLPIVNEINATDRPTTTTSCVVSCGSAVFCSLSPSWAFFCPIEINQFLIQELRHFKRSRSISIAY